MHIANLESIIIQPTQPIILNPLLLKNAKQGFAVLEDFTRGVSNGLGIPDRGIEILGSDEAVVACSQLSGWERADFAGTVEVEGFFQDLFADG